MEFPNWWIGGEVPGDPAGDAALRGTLAAGHRQTGVHCEAGAWCEGIALALTSEVRAVLDAPAPGSPGSSQAGFALAQEMSWPLRPGLTLAMAGGIGERAALGLARRPGGGAAVALRVSAGVAAELDRFGGPSLRLALSVQAARPLLRAEGPPLPADCTVRLELAARAGAPFHVTLPCGASGPIGFGLRATF